MHAHQARSDQRNSPARQLEAVRCAMSRHKKPRPCLADLRRVKDVVEVKASITLLLLRCVAGDAHHSCSLTVCFGVRLRAQDDRCRCSWSQGVEAHVVWSSTSRIVCSCSHVHTLMVSERVPIYNTSLLFWYSSSRRPRARRPSACMMVRHKPLLVITNRCVSYSIFFLVYGSSKTPKALCGGGGRFIQS